MGPAFSPRANFVAWASIVVLLLMIAGAATLGYVVQRSAYRTRVGVEIPQPVAFSHAHHVAGLGLDCRYCHTAVETSASAGYPPTATCMHCHWQLWTKAPMLKPIRQSWRTGKRIHWNRVYNLPDYVFFNHSIHVNKGIGCTTCHGAIDKMPLTYKASSLFMQWCLDCHRDPAPHLRPPNEIFDVNWKPPPDQAKRGKALMSYYHIHKNVITHCSVCHR